MSITRFDAGDPVAAGDAHRVWFPEMVEHLRCDLCMEALLRLHDELDDVVRYCSFNTINGSTRDADQAGHMHASSATTAVPMLTAARIAGSVGVTPNT
jgi:hypothetical protein